MRTASFAALPLLGLLALLTACDDPGPLAPYFASRAGAPVAPTNLVATPYSFEMITFSWQDNAIQVGWTDNSADESGFRIERAVASGGPWTSLGTTWANAVAFYDWQLPAQPPAADQPACYRVFAFNNYGDAQSSNVPCTAIPAAPSNVAATASGSDVNVTWTDNSAVEEGFQVLRGDAPYNLSVVATLPANANTYHDPGLPDNTYYYRVLATKDGGTSRESNTANVVVLTTPPPAPSPASVVPSSSSSVDIYWSDNSANETGFRVERSSDGGGSW